MLSVSRSSGAPGSAAGSGTSLALLCLEVATSNGDGAARADEGQLRLSTGAFACGLSRLHFLSATTTSVLVLEHLSRTQEFSTTIVEKQKKQEQAGFDDIRSASGLLLDAQGGTFRF
mmetsp:Transcript_13829/g.34088  ORF Transcript_13829/g.34088 Transcript_13829/m.34088 type:complete len:117 (+) Transcript_13829:1184-1534(+)